MELAVGGRRLDATARAIVITTSEAADGADGALGVDAVRVDHLDGAPSGVILVLTHRGADDAMTWFRDHLAHAPDDRVVLDPGSNLDRELTVLGRPLAVSIDDERLGSRIGRQALAMANGARVIVTAHPAEARRVADVLDAVRGCRTE